LSLGLFFFVPTVYLPVLFLEVDLALAAALLVGRGFFTSFEFVENDASSTFSLDV